MTTNDYQWLPMMTNDYQWLPLTTNDYQWLPTTTNEVTVYIDDPSIDDWSSILRSSILSVSTIYILTTLFSMFFFVHLRSGGRFGAQNIGANRNWGFFLATFLVSEMFYTFPLNVCHWLSLVSYFITHSGFQKRLLYNVYWCPVPIKQGGIKCANRRMGFIDSEGSHG